jgi:hypothetical protein
MKNTTLKISNTLRNFFNYSYKGDGKYYTTVAGSQHYNNTDFQSFFNKNTECIDITERGNDAPRGGKTGDFVIVKFNDKFFAKYSKVIEALENEKKEAKLAEEIKVNQREESAKKAELIFTEYLTPEKKEELKKELSLRNSKKAKNFLKMKSINKTGDYYNYSILEKMIYA